MCLEFRKTVPSQLRQLLTTRYAARYEQYTSSYVQKEMQAFKRKDMPDLRSKKNIFLF